MHIVTKNLSNNPTSHKRIGCKGTDFLDILSKIKIMNRIMYSDSMYSVEEYLDVVKDTSFLLQLQVLL